MKKLLPLLLLLGGLAFGQTVNTPTLQRNNTWIGTNVFNGAVTFGGAVSIPCSGLPALTGDVTSAGGTCTTLFPNIVSAGSGTKITFNAKGQVTASAAATLASSDFANQGTTTTLLHGNAAGNPSFTSVTDADLANAYSGTGTCTNQFVTVLNRNAAPTCTTDTLASAQHANQGTTTTVLHGNAAGNPSFTSVVSADLNITTSTCTNQFLTAISASGTGTCTSASLASAQFANQGTTTTVLHGNGAGNPAFGAVGLTTDVSGTLPTGNGGTGQTVASTFPTTAGAIPTVFGCGANTACANTAFGNTAHIFQGACPFSSSTTCTTTGMSPAYTNSGSYLCVAGDGTNTGETFKITYVSGSSFTITASASNSDLVAWHCIGN